MANLKALDQHSSPLKWVSAKELEGMSPASQARAKKDAEELRWATNATLFKAAHEQKGPKTQYNQYNVLLRSGQPGNIAYLFLFRRSAQAKRQNPTWKDLRGGWSTPT